MLLKRMLLIAAIALAVRAQAAAVPEAVTLSVKVGNKPLLSSDLVVMEKSGYIYLLLNLPPYQAELAPKGLEPLLKEVVAKEGLSRFPKAKLFKIDVADIAGRDDYGLPAWEKVKLLERYTAKPGKKGVVLAKAKKPK